MNHANQVYTNANLSLPLFYALSLSSPQLFVEAIWRIGVSIISSLFPVCIFFIRVCAVCVRTCDRVHTSHSSSKITIIFIWLFAFISFFVVIQYYCHTFMRSICLTQFARFRYNSQKIILSFILIFYVTLHANVRLNTVTSFKCTLF